MMILQKSGKMKNVTPNLTHPNTTIFVLVCFSQLFFFMCSLHCHNGAFAAYKLSSMSTTLEALLIILHFLIHFRSERQLCRVHPL